MDPDTLIRVYDEGRDLKAIERIWFECGWLESDEQARYLPDVLSVGHCLTAALDDSAECMVHISPGHMYLASAPLEMCAVTAVTTSRIGRKQGLAQQLTALQLANGARGGAAVAALGMFEQGFYNRVGFGSGSYRHHFSFDPATLRLDVPYRTPRRLTAEHWREMHGALHGRLLNHGACVLTPPELLKADLCWSDDGFGLGYFDEDELSHFMWLKGEGEHGPYEVEYIAYRSRSELLELLNVLKSLGDQISMVEMEETAHLQLQDVLRQPMRNRRNTEGSSYANEHESLAEWQLRVLDVPACVGAYRAPGHDVAFNLALTDPLRDYLPGDGWCGVGGDYVVRVGASSSAEPGTDPSLPTLEAGVAAFSRLLFGIVSASNLSASDELGGPDGLLGDLDGAFVLPRAVPGWEF